MEVARLIHRESPWQHSWLLFHVLSVGSVYLAHWFYAISTDFASENCWFEIDKKWLLLTLQFVVKSVRDDKCRVFNTVDSVCSSKLFYTLRIKKNDMASEKTRFLKCASGSSKSFTPLTISCNCLKQCHFLQIPNDSPMKWKPSTQNRCLNQATCTIVSSHSRWLGHQCSIVFT